MKKTLFMALCINLLTSTLHANLVILPDGSTVPTKQVQSVITVLTKLCTDRHHSDRTRVIRAHITLCELYDNAQQGSPLLPGIRDPFVQARWANEDGYITESIRPIVKAALTIRGSAIHVKTAEEIVSKSPRSMRENVE
jgi:hypothetical protein